MSDYPIKNIYAFSKKELAIIDSLQMIVDGETFLQETGPYTSKQLFEVYYKSPYCVERETKHDKSAYVAYYQSLKSICMKSIAIGEPVLRKLNVGTGRGHISLFEIKLSSKKIVR
jgi:hypothetical protein